jgi:PAS domain S-box-containing protein
MNLSARARIPGLTSATGRQELALPSRRKTPDSPPPAHEPAPEAELDEVLETAIEAFYAFDGEWRLNHVNGAAAKYFGLPREALLGRVLWDVFPQGFSAEFEAACRRAMVHRTPSVLEGRSRRRPDQDIELKIVPMGEGGAGVWLADMTERRRTEAALRAERDRNAEILESISDAFYAIDQDFRLTYVNHVAEAWWGRPRDQLLGQVFWKAFPQVVGTGPHAALLEAAAERKVVRLETISPVLGRWIDVSIFPSGSGLSVYFRDISERKHAEQRQRLLVNELNHRVKNSLAVVQAIARQTLRDGRDVRDAREALTARLVALAGAHDVLTQEKLSGADLEEVIERAVLAQLDRPERVALAGPHVRAPPTAALSLSLALHELATNALKYGALSTAEGRVELMWQLVEGAGRRRLRLRWSEHGGPPVRPPARKGFGSRLIEKALAADIGGTVRLAFEPAGVVCDIDMEAPPPWS